MRDACFVRMLTLAGGVRSPPHFRSLVPPVPISAQPSFGPTVRTGPSVSCVLRVARAHLLAAAAPDADADLAAPCMHQDCAQPAVGRTFGEAWGCLSMSGLLDAMSRSLSALWVMLPARAQGTHARAHVFELTPRRHGAGGGGGGGHEGGGPLRVAHRLLHACYG